MPKSLAVAVGVLVVFGVAGGVAGGPTDGQREIKRASRKAAQLVELGRRLFFDPAVSTLGERSCASCHDPEHGFGDPAARSDDDNGPSRRHSQSLIDVDVNAAQHWDGEFASVAALARSRIDGTGSSVAQYYVPTGEPRDPATPPTRLSPTERLVADLGSREDSEGPVRPALVSRGTGDGARRVRDGGRYESAVESLGQGADLDAALASEALAAYVASLKSGRSLYDRFRAGDEDALGAEARRGLDLFQGVGRCAECHRLDNPGGWPLLRDGKFHNTGVAYKESLPGLSGFGASALRGSVFADFDPGRGAFDQATGMQRAFKTPSLRDVARSAPYFHDGSRETLEDVVRHYVTGCGTDPERDERLRGFHATPDDVKALVAFLHALTSEQRPGLSAQPWAARVQRTRLRFVNQAGEPMKGLSVGLEPAGDVVPGAREPSLPKRLTTDARGEISYAVPARTHVRLRLEPGLACAAGDLVPDTCASATIRLPVVDRALLHVAIGPGAVRAPEHIDAYVVTDPLGRPLRGAGGVEVEALTRFMGRAMTRVPLVRRSVERIGAHRLVEYGAWLPVGVEEVDAFLRLPGQKEAQPVRLERGKTTRIAAYR